MSSPCDVKKMYDTEFEAERAASQTAAFFDSEMVPYKCGSHWHIANKNPALRSKRRSFEKTYCDVCDVYMLKKTYEAHTRKLGHMRREKERDPKESLLL